MTGTNAFEGWMDSLWGNGVEYKILSLEIKIFPLFLTLSHFYFKLSLTVDFFFKLFFNFIKLLISFHLLSVDFSKVKLFLLIFS